MAFIPVVTGTRGFRTQSMSVGGWRLGTHEGEGIELHPWVPDGYKIHTCIVHNKLYNNTKLFV